MINTSLYKPGRNCKVSRINSDFFVPNHDHVVGIILIFNVIFFEISTIGKGQTETKK